mgnify:CR=1 FL=1
MGHSTWFQILNSWISLVCLNTILMKNHNQYAPAVAKSIASTPKIMDIYESKEHSNNQLPSLNLMELLLIIQQVFQIETYYTLLLDQGFNLISKLLHQMQT